MPIVVGLRLAFVAWHVFAGFLGTSLLYRARFGRMPHVAWRARTRSRHRVIQVGMGAVSAVWAGTVLAHVLAPGWQDTALGRPLVEWPAVAGWVVAGLGHVGMVGSQLAMGRALRVGLEESGPLAPQELATGGPFSFSRHPVYVCSMLFLAGEWVWNPSLACGLAVIALMLGFHGLAVEEDRVLAARFGAAHREYAERVRRYL
ncbi:MAG: isoprenylcysteine carboxylmethyltransferase family protein [Deltaproteobacteria bacterium]|nr:isoprenylcysteine carboxylmethyltransferase family protein [Deltaproteobacteria bacterium]